MFRGLVFSDDPAHRPILLIAWYRVNFLYSELPLLSGQA
jgi:hypothetical protein